MNEEQAAHMDQLLHIKEKLNNAIRAYSLAIAIEDCSGKESDVIVKDYKRKVEEAEDMLNGLEVKT